MTKNCTRRIVSAFTKLRRLPLRERPTRKQCEHLVSHTAYRSGAGGSGENNRVYFDSGIENNRKCFLPGSHAIPTYRVRQSRVLDSPDLTPSKKYEQHSILQAVFTKKKFALYHIQSSSYYKKASASELTTLRPTTNQPVCCTCLLVIMLAVSQAKCLKPLKEW